MRDFLKMMRRYASPYKVYFGGAVLLNVFSAVFNIFSFAVIIPLLNILFKIETGTYEFIPWETEGYRLSIAAMKRIIRQCPPPAASADDILAAWNETKEEAR